MTAQGDLTPCPFVPYAIGNVKELALADMWRGYCEAIPPTDRGECPMNDLDGRSLLHTVVASAAERLRERSAR